MIIHAPTDEQGFVFLRAASTMSNNLYKSSLFSALYRMSAVDLRLYNTIIGMLDDEESDTLKKS